MDDGIIRDPLKEQQLIDAEIQQQRHRRGRHASDLRLPLPAQQASVLQSAIDDLCGQRTVALLDLP